jgi:hypothetical protein
MGSWQERLVVFAALLVSACCCLFLSYLFGLAEGVQRGKKLGKGSLSND